MSEETVVAPEKQGESTMVFRSEEDRLNAINALPEKPPAGTDLATWQQEMDAKQDEIMAAEIGEPREEPTQKGGDSSESEGSTGKRPYSAEDWTFTHKGKTYTVPEDELPDDPTFTFKDAKKMVLSSVESQHYIQKIRKEHDEESRTLSRKLEEKEKESEQLRQQLEAAKKVAPSGASTHVDGGEASTLDGDISKARGEIEALQAELDKLDDYDPDSSPLMRKILTANTKLNSLTGKRLEIERKNQAKQREVAEQESKTRQEDEAAKSAAKKEAEEKDRQQRKAQEKIDDFKKDSDTFKSKKSYAEMEKDFISFGKKVAATYWDKDESKVTWKDIEFAMAKYLKGSPALKDSLETKGIDKEEPKDMREYLVLSEVDLLMRGFTVDESTGEYVPVKNEVTGQQVTHPDFDSAYEYWKKKNGRKQQEMVEYAKKVQNQTIDALTKKGAAELESTQGSKKGDVEVSKEQAEESMTKLEKQILAKRISGTVEESVERMRMKNEADPLVVAYDKFFDIIYG